MEIEKKRKTFDSVIKIELNKINSHKESWEKINRHIKLASESINESIDGDLEVQLSTDPIDKSRNINAFSIINGLSSLDGLLKKNVLDKSLDNSKRELYLNGDYKSIFICEIKLSEDSSKFTADFGNKKITYFVNEDGLFNFLSDVIKEDGFVPSVSKMKNRAV